MQLKMLSLVCCQICNYKLPLPCSSCHDRFIFFAEWKFYSSKVNKKQWLKNVSGFFFHFIIFCVSCPHFLSDIKRMSETFLSLVDSFSLCRFLLMHNPHCFNGYFIMIYFKYAFFNNSFLNSSERSKWYGAKCWGGKKEKCRWSSITDMCCTTWGIREDRGGEIHKICLPLV